MSDTWKRLEGFYIGEVIQHLSHGCLKVFIPSIHNEDWHSQPDFLPPCYQVTPLFGGSNLGNGTFSYPNIGAKVVCGFANGDQSLIYCFGVLNGGQDAIHQYCIANQVDDSKVIESLKDGQVTDASYKKLHPLEAVSEGHRFTIGKTSLTFFEHGTISASVDVPIPTHISALSDPQVKADVVMDQSGLISAATYDYSNQIHSLALLDTTGKIVIETADDSNKTHSRITMDSNGNIAVDTTNQLDVIVKEESGSTRSHINMNSAGSIVCDSSTNVDITTQTTNITSPTVNITGVINHLGDITTTGNSVITGTSNIGGATEIAAALTVKADATISNKSFLGHMHTGNLGAPTSPPL